MTLEGDLRNLGKKVNETSHSKQKNDFKLSDEIGKFGESLGKQFVHQVLKVDVRDVRSNEFYQKKDIDFLANYNNRTLKFEVKTDTTNTPNLFYETYSDFEHKSIGAIARSEADYLIYVFINHNLAEFYLIKLPEFKNYIKNTQLREVSFKRKGLTMTVTTKGLLVPLNVLNSKGKAEGWSKRIVVEGNNFKQVG